MPATPPARTMPHRARLLAALLAALIVTCAGAVVAAPGAHAASQGTGFGTWAPISTYGWHGSMLIDGVHTYCILPGAPAPTGQSMDQGVSGTAAGLSAQQLTGINLLVTKYGQTNDPVQAAAVGWAVKAVANLNETLHHFGYQGDSLAEAIHWTFSALAPEHSAEVQRLAVMYYDEARAAPAGVAGASGTMVFTTDAADPRRGSVRVDASTAAATGTLSLAGATFVATGTSTLTDAVPGVEYPILADSTGCGPTVHGQRHRAPAPHRGRRRPPLHDGRRTGHRRPGRRGRVRCRRVGCRTPGSRLLAHDQHPGSVGLRERGAVRGRRGLRRLDRRLAARGRRCIPARDRDRRGVSHG